MIDLSKYTLRNEANEDRASLYIYGDIISDSEASLWELFGLNHGVGPTDFRKALEDVGDKPLDVFISSDGGDVPSGLSIANMLGRRKAETVGHVDGWAASIAGVIFLACQKRLMPKNTFLMLHRPSIYNFSGNVDDMKKAMEFLENTGNTILGFIEDRALDKDKVSTISENYVKEHWYNAEEAAAYFDISVEPEATYQTAAKCTAYKMPDQMLANFKAASMAATAAGKSAEEREKALAALNNSFKIIYGN